jgi:hypothetical protein
MRLIRQKCFAGVSAFQTQCPDGTNNDSFISKNGKRLSDWRESQDAFNYAVGDFDAHELSDKEFKDKPVIKKIKRGGKPVYKIGARFNYDPKKYGPVGPGNRTSFIVGASDKEKVSDVYRDFLKHIKGLDDYGYTTDKESIEGVKKSLKEEIRHQARKAKMKKIGTTAAITAGVAGAAYGGKKLYDRYKKDKT